MGILGGLFVLLLYVIILIRAGMIARKTEKLFPKYLVLGSALMLSIQAFVNMAVAVNLIPVTGQPLPLISRGGTSTLITCAYFGLILSADRFGIGKKKVKENDETETGGDEGNDNDNNSRNLLKEIKTVDKLEDKVEFEIIQV